MKKSKRAKAIKLKSDVFCVTTTELDCPTQKMEKAVVDIIEDLKEFQSKVDRKICEMKKICLGEINER